ncbi:hypothetical protein EYD45_02455 [Hyunsoonleella flava]|uniref:Uncharacterized protein n=1 Tax=Hyunsoonleella flava TaxID=2527939 RepID=A0A4V2JAH3_9FLAO|nr:hypothetical protein [Hyunsoonleella flava]TBN06766.1 hypothetical protein EYD45_02455 [Hyunsoonleella flava]
MEPATWGFIGTILGTIVGTSASIFATYLNGKNTINIQKSTEKYKREELFREFQRNNLLKLQDEFSVGMRLIGKLHTEAFAYFKKNSTLKGFRVSDDIDAGINKSFQNLMKLTERVNDDKLRMKIIEIRMDMASFSISDTDPRDNVYIEELGNKFEKLMTDIGIELRNNFK